MLCGLQLSIFCNRARNVVFFVWFRLACGVVFLCMCCGFPAFSLCFSCVCLVCVLCVCGVAFCFVVISCGSFTPSVFMLVFPCICCVLAMVCCVCAVFVLLCFVVPSCGSSLRSVFRFVSALSSRGFGFVCVCVAFLCCASAV